MRLRRIKEALRIYLCNVPPLTSLVITNIFKLDTMSNGPLTNLLRGKLFLRGYNFHV